MRFLQRVVLKKAGRGDKNSEMQLSPVGHFST